MKKIKIGIIGHFGLGNEIADGQSIKTKMIYEELKNKYKEENICILDTHHWKKNIMKNIYICIKFKLKCSNIIILPAQNSVKVLVPFFVNNKMPKCKIHYIMIGGWLPSLIKNNKRLIKDIKKIDYIYSETNVVKEQLKKLEITNVLILKNFKKLEITSSKYDYDKNNIKLCIFSRIEKLKGIDDAIDVVKKLNKNLKVNIKLDIYGPIKEEYKERFLKQIKDVEFINYCGVVAFDESVKTIEKYNILLFPTLFETEGIPGTIIDSYFAGVPVISSKWQSFNDVIIDGKTGIGYKFGDKEDFYDKLCDLINNQPLLNTMSKNCKKYALNYTAENSLKVLYDLII